MTSDTDTRVLYNAECPVCSFEIGHYRDYAEARDLPIRFDDLNGPERAQWGLSEDAAARRLYVLKDGTLHGGLDAFLVLWRQMPRYRWLARAVALPGVRQAASALYDYVLAPLIYRWHLRRKARARA
ncbi:thiol-disulfide oxidoreductase DCC family protein [Rhodosalinus sp. K401]|uniref:thiol-disulfide oxidoreductase DCC family protein n=1 Tax=Rhodosalinus sp. K401 TaxID=3239195 RepID=UPI00352387F7